MKNFGLGLLAGFFVFVLANNQAPLMRMGKVVVNKTKTALSNAFIPQVKAAVEPIKTVEQRVVKTSKQATKSVSKSVQRVANQVIHQAQANDQVPKKPVLVAQTQPLEQTIRYKIPSKPNSDKVSQYKSRTNSRTSISLVTE